jgi:hypothetical protein
MSGEMHAEMAEARKKCLFRQMSQHNTTKLRIGNESLQEISNDNGIGLG